MDTNDELFQAVGRIEQKVDQLLDRDADKETRLRSLERERNYVRGFIGAVSFAVAFFFKGH